MSEERVKFRIYGRMQHEVNTDPKRRCYHGCHFSSEMVWSEWNHLGTVFSVEDAEASVNSWGLSKDPTREYKWVTNEEHLELEKRFLHQET